MTRIEPTDEPLGAPAWTSPGQAGKDSGGVLAAIGILVGGILFLAVLGYLMLAIGVGPVVTSTLVALVPLAVLLLAVRWIDRWEPEPRSALWFAFLWGAGVSVALALLVDLGLRIAGAGGASDDAEFFATVVQAPVVEEIAKGLGVLILAFAGRRFFDGPVDGVVYAAVIAAGFTFTEDVLYFAGSFVEGGAEGLAGVFVVRGILSPFAHMMFTACTGFAVGWASQRMLAGGVVLAWFVGLIPAIALHALWNSAAYFAADFLGYYVVVQVPLFVLAVLLVVFLRRQEARVTRARLEEYAHAGWFLPGEVEWLATPQGRSRARRWAAGRHPGAADAMKRFIRDATKLAFARQRAVTGRAGIGHQENERALLAAIVADRRALLG